MLRILSSITHINPWITNEKEEEDEREESSLSKWVTNSYSTNNIISNVEGGFKTRCHIWENLNDMCFTSTILPKNVKEAL